MQSHQVRRTGDPTYEKVTVTSQIGQGTEEGRAAAEAAQGQSGGCCRKRGGDALILQQGAGTATLLRGVGSPASAFMSLGSRRGLCNPGLR